MIKAFEIAASGLSAERLRMDIISSNIANSNTVKTEDGGPYRKRSVVFEAVPFKNYLSKVKVADVIRDDNPPKLKYEPNNPLADKNGYVKYPDINPIIEMTDLIEAMRAYQANSSVIDAAKSIVKDTLSVLG
ncbi:MAG: flagellar basal-body rod protein FlgC [bacterium]|nr:MAG: flagellar basal-body rod protein FlgC [bacterium]